MKKYLPTIIFVAAVIGIIVFAIVSASSSKNDSTGQEPVKVSDQDAALLKQGPSEGKADSTIILTEFGDLQCPVCLNYHKLLKSDILPNYGDKIKLVWKHFPLNPTPHKNAFNAAVAAESADVQGKFWPMHDKLFDTQTEWSDLANPEDKYADYAGQIGLDVSKFRSDYESKKFDDKINSDKNLGTKLQVQGTPTFFLNGVQVPTDGGPEGIKKALDAALKK